MLLLVFLFTLFVLPCFSPCSLLLRIKNSIAGGAGGGGGGAAGGAGGSGGGLDLT
jgi:hypothetical protein